MSADVRPIRTAAEQALAEAFAAHAPARAGDPLASRRAAALNTAFMGDGGVLRLADGVALTRPIHLVFVYAARAAAAVFARSLIVIGNGARATLIESHEGPNDLDYQVNNALELSIGDDA